MSKSTQPAKVTKSRRRYSKVKGQEKVSLTEAWHTVLMGNFKDRLSDAELEEAFRQLMGTKFAQPAARIRGFFNSPKFPYFQDLGLTPPTVRLPKFVEKKPVGKKSIVEAYVKAYGTEAEKKALEG